MLGIKKPRLNVLTLFVTSRCNARCRTCFYWQELNQVKNELTLEEFERIAAQMPAFEHLLLSGGEPLLRQDLVPIVKLFLSRSARVLALPTNGLLPEKASQVTQELLRLFPQHRIILGVSIDALEEANDHIRGARGSFARACETLTQLATLRKDAPNLRLTSLTVVMNYNQEEVPALLDFLSEKFLLDYLTVEPWRGSAADEQITAPDSEALHKIQTQTLRLNAELYRERSPEEAPLFLTYQTELFRAQYEFLKTGKLPLTCRAGQTVTVIEPDGRVRLCELLPPIGNLRECDYDFMALWESAAAKQQRRQIHQGKCACTHCVNVSHSLDYDWRSARRLRGTRRRWQHYLADPTSTPLPF